MFSVRTNGQSAAGLEASLDNAVTPAQKYDSNIQLARFWANSGPEKGLLYARAALEIATNLHDRHKCLEASLMAGQIAEAQHNDSDAYHYYMLAKDSFDLEQQDIAFATLGKMEKIALVRQDYKAAYALSKERSVILEQLAKKSSEAILKKREEEVVAERQKTKYWLSLSILGALMLGSWYYFSLRSDRRIRGEMAEKNALIEEKRRRSEQLLLNILPPAVAAELTVRNKVLARRYEHATVMFIDFVGFTKVAEALSPEELVYELDYCFSEFDAILDRLRIEKIKTVGDAYICASGLTDRNERPTNMIKAALAIQLFLDAYANLRKAAGKKYFEARIGIHFGPVVAGIVGTKKFAYDIWGDTVNTAARLEEVCEPRRINVGGAAMEIAQSEFKWEYRGKIATKNKAEMDMYYVSE
jgi:adenylate cyclase